MVKCAVQGCPNRPGGGVVRGKASKRFFSFPQDPARVKVWLAALREIDRDPSEFSEICEDHFLPEHIMPHGIREDAIPLAPYLEGPVGASDSESDQEERPRETVSERPPLTSAPVDLHDDGRGMEEEDAGGDDDDDDEEDDDEEDDEDDDDDDEEEEGDDDDAVFQVNRAEDVRKQDPLFMSFSETTPSQKNTGEGESTRYDVSLSRLTHLFMRLLSASPDGVLDLNDAARHLGTRKRRVYDITNVLDGINLVEKKSTSKIHWVSSTPISAFSGMFQAKLREEVEQLKSMEEALDRLIKECSRNLFDLTDNKDCTQDAYVTHEDLFHIQAFQDQTLIAIRAPEETKLDVPTPKKERISMHLKGTRGPIHVLTCEMTPPTANLATPTPGREKAAGFLTLEESRIKTTAKGSSSLPAPVQSA
ncbi:transcription factor E2F2 isoform X2 [Engraulis encrasicolus]|uniref:transcription factor E2F2 isoform X2 n=1 Tax=Engraulis encrasicolus TaxID=184585 RepID=UPI002FD18394